MAYLNDSIKIRRADYRDVITVRAPGETEIAFFKLPDDNRVPVVGTRRTAYDDRSKPFWVTPSIYPANREQSVVKVGDVPSGSRDT